MNETLPRIFALGPKGRDGIGVVAAACRASAFGIVDLSSQPRIDAAGVFGQIARLTSGKFGVRLDADEALELPWLEREFAGLEPFVCDRARWK